MTPATYLRDRQTGAAIEAAMKSIQGRPLIVDPRPARRFRHVKTGAIYYLEHESVFQCSGDRAHDNEAVMIYVCEETGSRWVRPTSEFNDGRFIELRPGEV